MSSFAVSVGRLHWKKLRDFLNQCKFNGINIDYIESSGFLSREFSVKGNDEHITIVLNAILDENGYYKDLRKEKNE